MLRKATALFALAAFALFSSGCMTRRTAEMRTLPKPPAQGAAVLSVVTVSGEKIDFSKSSPGQLTGQRIVGTATNGSPHSVSIPLSEVRTIEYKTLNVGSTVLLFVGLAAVVCAGVFAPHAPSLGNIRFDSSMGFRK